MPTTNQINTGCRQLAETLAEHYPPAWPGMARAMVRAIKTGTALQKDVAKFLLQKFYGLATGKQALVAGVPQHHYKQWVRELIQADADGDTFAGTTITDATDAEAVSET